MIQDFIEHFSEIEDPRYQGFFTYPMQEIRLTALVGVICGAEDGEDMT